MEWIIYLLIGLAIAFIHYKALDVRAIWELVAIAIFWPVVLVLDALILFY